ncbi:hypothetical protein PT974_09643 [Cladobotryum mycophilum]|uniref:Putative gamma-glutamylcyclotransferase n=1 Tax=Cladobotryum mycophilum TaxID=491253 RepID=A0ABR0SGR8_9HYPO
MELLTACEGLAANIAAFDFVDDDQVLASDIERWEQLFSLSPGDAVNAIKNWRSDFARSCLSEAAWEDIREQKLKEGYDKEAYEYSLFRYTDVQKTSPADNSRADNSMFMLKLEDILSSVEAVREVASLESIPKLIPGVDEDGNSADFCHLTGVSKTRLLDALSRMRISWRPTIIRISIASKNLSPVSLSPTLGIDTTLPQYRPSQSATPVIPAQDEYPVWYFFYGTLGDAKVLSRVLGLGDQPPEYKQARVRRGRLSSWAGKYLGLVDADENSTVDGWAYLVTTGDEEDALRAYETDKYDVVRCSMEFVGEDSLVPALTFRLV